MTGTVFDGDPALRQAARDLLLAHDRAAPSAEAERASESDIRRKIGNLLVAGGVVAEGDLTLEADRTDLSTPALIVEVKRRIGSQIEPDPRHIRQLDGYLAADTRSGQVRLGVLTDGKHWVLRLPSEKGAEARTQKPYSLILHSPEAAGDWAVWLQERAQAFGREKMPPTVASVEAAFGLSSRAEEMVTQLRALYADNDAVPTVLVKRELWEQLLGTALGEVVAEQDLDDLFVRHTYLASVVALSLQCAFGIDIEAAASTDPGALVDGREFTSQVGVRGVIESDFFGWVTEVNGGGQWIRDMSRWASVYDWAHADFDVARVLYQSVISADQRKRLGEYYTPDWLAEAVVDKVVDDPLSQRVLDPACGSGTFLRAVIAARIRAAREASQPPEDTLRGLIHGVIGVDIHPVAVHLARATWVNAARDVISSVPAGSALLKGVSVPVYLGDSLQLGTDPGGLFSQDDKIRVEVEPSEHREHMLLEFPSSFTETADKFDAFMLDAADTIKAGGDPAEIIKTFAASSDDRTVLRDTLAKIRSLHEKGQNHIWAYYTRNHVRPAWLEKNQVDRIVGNPPWLAYNQTRSTIRNALEEQAKTKYGIWPKPHYVTHTDLAGLFFSRCFHLYLKQRGKMGMVLPHSALGAGQYEMWRKARWGVAGPANLSSTPWDLEQLEPNDFFPVPASVVFANKTARSKPLPMQALQWRGPAGGATTKHKTRITASAVGFQSPYAARAAQGATIVPRLLFMVTAEPSKISIVQGVSTVSPARSPHEKEPWRSLTPQSLMGQAIETRCIFDIHTGDTLAPFVLLDPAKAVLPIVGDGLAPGDVPSRTKTRWKEIDDLWETHKGANSRLSLLEQLDYMGKLTKQLASARIRVLYSTSGSPTAAVCRTPDAIVDSSLYWIRCATLGEAHYLAAIINSEHLSESVAPLMPKGQYGARHLHKHLWKLDIPAYDPNDVTHQRLSTAGKQAAAQAAKAWQTRTTQRLKERKAVNAKAARADLRQWLVASRVGKTIETQVALLF